MIAISLDKVSVVYVSQPVFAGLSWQIHDDRCVGLVGPNGCGKSTLLRLITGELSSDSGFLVRQKGLSIGYLPQEPQLPEGISVFEAVRDAPSPLADIDQELAHIEQQLGDPEVYNYTNRLARLLDRQTDLLRQYTELGGAGFEGSVRTILQSLGFEEASQALPLDVLSGGQKKLVGLARLIVMKPDILLLDEPDNHLDLDGKAFLERFIRSFDGGVVIVSHDRYLLDLVVDEIAELEDGRLSLFPGNYSEYAFEKQTQLLRQQHLFQAQQKEINRLEQSAKRLLTWGKVYDNEKFIKRGQNILKRIERIERIDKPVLERRKMGLDLKGWRGSNKVLEINGLFKNFPADGEPDSETIVLAGLDMLIWHGERVGLVGPNGAGKSLLFRIILGEEAPSDGQIVIGPSVKIGYYAQQHETLDYNLTLIDTIRQHIAYSESQAVAFLNRFLFTYNQQRGLVGNLSGGERSRLQLALLMLSSANFLLLDEPTNNLDIASAEVLENALAEFEGTVLVISHDRYFLDRAIERVEELDDGVLHSYAGGYSDYQAARQHLIP